MHAAQDYIYNKIAHASRAYRRRHSVGQLDRALKECSNERPVQLSSRNLVVGGISSDLRYFGEPKPKSTNLRSRANCQFLYRPDPDVFFLMFTIFYFPV